MTKPFVYLFTLAILALTVLACAPAEPTATPAPTPTAVPTPTATPIVAARSPSPTPQPTAATPNYYPYTPIPPTATPDETDTCSRFPDKARLFREHDAISWSECPVIENGVLRASGTVKGGRALLNRSSIATFVIKHRNSDRDALVILRRVPTGWSYPNQSKTAVATHWEVDSKSFSIRVPVGNLDSPVDLLVWGSDIRSVYVNAPPLAIRSIGYIR